MIPEGWHLVPKEPTREMFEDWRDAYDRALIGSGVAWAWDDAYKAMLSAAPPSPVAESGWQGIETLRTFIDRQGDKLRTMKGSISWRNGYGAALDNITKVLDALPAPPHIADQRPEVK